MNQAQDRQEAASKPENPPLLTGSCSCGAIQFSLSALPVKSYLCHCLDCRRNTGSSFAHNASFPLTSLAIFTQATKSSGESSKPVLDDVLSTFGDKVAGRRQFCKICGTGLFLFPPWSAETERDKVIIPVGMIDGSHEDERLRPTAEGWCRRKEAWMLNMKGTTVSEEW